MTKRSICVISGTRADFGLLAPVLDAIDKMPSLTSRLLVTGAHLAPQFGETVLEIEASGRPIWARVPLALSDDSRRTTACAIGDATVGISKALSEDLPDVIFVLGDRYEILGAASAALALGIPIAHAHGGEVTEGAFDEQIRHAVTKMAHLHFVAAAQYRARVIQMGEQPARVFNVGALALDVMDTYEKMTRSETLQRLALAEDDHYVVVTWHPETATHQGETHLQNLTQAMDETAHTGTKFIVTGVNADPGYTKVHEIIQSFAAKRPADVRCFTSLGSTLYTNTMRHAAAVVGNSSSGIIEAPSLGVPTVNIGERQRGRLRAASVIDCAPETHAITDALKKVQTNDFRQAIKDQQSPLGTPGAARRIAAVLSDVDLSALIPKRFHDIPSGNTVQ